MTRQAVLGELAALIEAIERPHPVRVAIDGIDAAGKTTLADELAAFLGERGRPIIRASVDGFHRPRAERYRRGPDSPDGYYLDSFDYEALVRELLDPLGPYGDRRYRPATFDYRNDTPIVALQSFAPENAILLFDGIFLLRPELNAFWDMRIFVEVDFEEALRRGVERDGEVVRDRYLKRYLLGQRIYLDSVRPAGLADTIVHNADLNAPRLVIRDQKISS